MRNILLLFSVALSMTLHGQVSDSLTHHQLDSLSRMAMDFAAKRDFVKAREINAGARSMALEKFGRQSSAYGNACFDHGAILLQSGAYAEAEKWFLECADIYAKTLGEEHPYFVLSLDNLSDIYLRMKDFEKSERYHIQVRDIREKVLGKQHKDYVSSLGNLANLYTEMGAFEQATPIYLEAIALREKVSGKEHRDYATSLNNLGLNYLKAGNYDKAEPLLSEAFQIRQRVVGNKHPHYASSLNNLGQLYADKGDFETAEPFLIQAKEARAEIFGKNHPAYAWSLNNLGQFYMYIGAYEKAEPLFKEAIELKENTVGIAHPDYAISVQNLAKIYVRQGRYAAAEPLLLAGQHIYEEKLEPQHPDYLSGLRYLSAFYLASGNAARAEEICLKEKRIWEESAQTGHPHYALCLQGLASVYARTGRLNDAKKWYQEAATIFLRVFGEAHPAQAELRLRLADMNWAMQDIEAAANHLSAASQIEQALLAKASRHLSERELSSYIRMFGEVGNHLLSLTLTQPELADLSYAHVLFHKGLLLNTRSQIARFAYQDDATKDQFSAFQSFSRRLAAEYSKPEQERKNVAELEAQVNTLEKALAKSVAGFAEAMQPVSWQEIREKLRPGEAAIEFIDFPVARPQPTDSILYAALVLLPDTDQPVFVPLFEEKQLSALLQPRNESKADFINALYAGQPGEMSLYNLLWRPLEPMLGNVSTVYFSASGLLHRINLSAVAAPAPVRGATGTAILSDVYQLIQVGSTRQLKVADLHVSSVKPDALLYGGIQYEADTAAVANTGTFPASGTAPAAGRDGWNHLRWTEVEIGAIEAILKDAGINAALRQGRLAHEASFKTIGTTAPSPKVLHLATHGFFFPDPKLAPYPVQPSADDWKPVFKISDQPMIRSGLILAGGNYAWKNGRPLRPEMEDGILTSYEISQTNLSNTELAVLSACETGLGEIQGNEGVFGLQRAFKIAGVRYLIMSLWQVPDFQTQELMTAFYSNWLDRKMPLPDAFRAAQQEMRRRFNNPFYWAGFILVE